MKLGRRLNTIAQLVPQDVSLIWDGCCDHGYLGQQLLQQSQAHVNFVDIAAHITLPLQQELQASFPDHRYQVITASMTDISLPSTPRQLVILAGIGGDLMIEILRRLLEQPQFRKVPVILCSVNRNFQIRRFLHRFGFQLHQEQLVSENKRFYEIIMGHFEPDSCSNISDIGAFWDLQEPQHMSYLHRLEKHYAQCMRGRNRLEAKQAELALAAYQSLRLSHQSK